MYYLNICEGGEEEKVFVRAGGAGYEKHYMLFMKEYLRSIGVTESIQSLKEFCKCESTATTAALSQAEMEHVSRQMGHSMATSERYYRKKAAGATSLTAFKNISKIATSTSQTPSPPVSVDVTSLILHYVIINMA